MLFNSVDFAIFLPVVFFLYWFVTDRNLKAQNLLIVVASYFFYGVWDWRFLFLIFTSSIVDFIIGLQLVRAINPLKKKMFLWVSLLVNLGTLGFLKYFNFFLESFISAFSLFGAEIKVNSLHILLPVGISFYTFQTMSYTIDVYKGRLQPSKDLISFLAFVSFFPQLVAGPIERATNLLSQFHNKRLFNYQRAMDGIHQMLWGLFKKVVIADSCAEFANQVFNNSANMNSSTLILGAVFFTFQIYGDFSGYSDIAIGTARLFGFNLMQNFSVPYFSRDIAEFWRRWHISLTTWFRDYIYIPLGGSRGSTSLRIRNTFIIFLISGLWHGANWTYVTWGGINAVYFLPLLLTKKNRNNLDTIAKGRLCPNLREVFQVMVTFCLTVFAWIFFRAENIPHAIHYIKGIFNSSILELPSIISIKLIIVIAFVCLMLVFEWFGRSNRHPLRFKSSQPKIINYLIVTTLIVIIIFFSGSSQNFIYFQF